MQRTPEALPPVTDAHRRAAFCAMRWVGWTFDAAVADPVRARVIECRAHAIRTNEWMQTHQRSQQIVRRCLPGADGHPLRWATQIAQGPYVPRTDLFPPPEGITQP